MLKQEVKWVTGTSVIIFCMWCYLLCSNNFMFAYSSLSSYANVNESWKNAGNGIYYDMTFAISILYSKGDDGAYPPFGFGFLTNRTSYDNYPYPYILAIYIGTLDNASSPVVVWCANRNRPVQQNAILNFTSQGDLVLRDADGSLVWSTDTSGLSVRSMQLLNGSLVLLNARGEPIWESFHYPTDTLLYNQVLSKGQRLVSNISTSNNSEGMFYASRNSDGIHAFVNSNPPQEYSSLEYDDLQYIVSNSGGDTNFVQVCNHSCHNCYVRLDQDGHLRWYRWNGSENFLGDVFVTGIYLGECGYPTTCGKYGVCTDGIKCACPPGNDGSLDYLKPNEAYNAESGCTLVTPLSCPDTHKLQTFLKIENVTYFDYNTSLIGTDLESCKIACLNNCSCKAAFFTYFDDSSSGNCTMPSELFTLTDVSEIPMDTKTVTVAFIKVQNRSKTATMMRKLVVPISSSLIALVLFIGACYMFIIRRRRIVKSIDCSQDIFVDTVTRLSYESLVTATQDFQTRLGRGGFGSVFEGTLGDGTKVAVKRLDSMGQGRKEFLAEVNTIGSLRHFNLVRLIGFCDDGSNRLLVYEYMCNGSLEKWIFKQDIAHLSWHIQQRIINGVAAGLEYLHVHCNQSVIHFDIKPQNILLDKDFNAKIADFGLAKMVDRDQSQVMTIVRGTLGYMAPELISGDRVISVKVDVYSFGILVLEILCGRRNFGSTEDDCLTNLVKLKANENQLYDLIDERAEAMQQHKEEVVNMMKIALWCLQPHVMRPTISLVVKVLQDLRSMESISDLSHFEAAPPVEANYEFSVRPTESLLSGPR